MVPINFITAFFPSETNPLEKTNGVVCTPPAIDTSS
jgi:hypothetical protein